ncbi:MAG: superoxide dismutase family protein [Pseudomonadota bacterium]
MTKRRLHPLRILCTLSTLAVLGLGSAAFAQNVGPIRVSMMNTDGDPAGDVWLWQTSDGVLADIVLRNLPEGWHALRIHERGLCDPPDFASAGDGYEFAGEARGGDGPGQSPAGHLPSVRVGSDGEASFRTVIPNVSLAADTSSPDDAPTLHDDDGSSIVLHAETTGTGGRIACGPVFLRDA